MAQYLTIGLTPNAKTRRQSEREDVSVDSPSFSPALQRELTEPLNVAMGGLYEVLEALPQHTNPAEVLSQVEAIGQQLLNSVNKIRDPELQDVAMPEFEE